MWLNLVQKIGNKGPFRRISWLAPQFNYGLCICGGGVPSTPLISMDQGSLVCTFFVLFLGEALAYLSGTSEARVWYCG